MDHFSALSIFWWLVLGLFISGVGLFLVRLAGAMLVAPILGQDNDERSRVLAAAGGHSEGYQVLLILCGGGIVGAWWPLFKNSLFSGLWLVLLFISLVILAGFVYQYRNRVAGSVGRLWDMAGMAFGFAVLIVLGIGIGTTVTGGAFHLSHAEAMWASFADRFSAYDVLVTGFLTVGLGLLLASASVASRLSGAVAERARLLVLSSGLWVLLCFAGGALWMTQLSGYAVTVGLLPSSGHALHLVSSVSRIPGAYLERFLSHLPFVVVPVIAVLLLLGSLFFAWKKQYYRVWVLAALFVPAMVATAGVMTFPVILPSWSDPASSWNLVTGASSSAAQIAYLVWIGVLTPAALAYQFWVMRHRRGA